VLIPDVVPTVEQPENSQQVRLRFDRDDLGTEPAEDSDPVAHVRSQVEGQIPGTEELPVEPDQPAPPPERSVVDGQRPAQSQNPPDDGGPGSGLRRRSLRHRRRLSNCDTSGPNG
jgi:hypothetical protein